VQGLPIIKPPYGTINAISLDKGTILWQTPHGETPDAVRNHALLKGLRYPAPASPTASARS
jgi:quinoprotein glucose dehydrogenase